MGTFAWIRGLSPLGPIFAKELRSTARQKRTYVLRFLYLGALLGVILFFYAVSRPRVAATVQQRAVQMAEMGAIFFAVFAFFSFFAMAIVGPILTATSINSERLHKTLPVLLMTPITAWQIVAGKLFSRLLIAITLLGLSLPALSVLRLLGGVEVDQIFGALAICVSLVVYTASVGLLFSTLMNRAYAVILLTYATFFFLYAIIPMMAMMIVAQAARTGPGPLWIMGVYKWMSLLHPFMAMLFVVVPRSAGIPFALFDWWWCVLANLGLSALILLVCALILRRMARKQNEGAAPAMPAMPPALAQIIEKASEDQATAGAVVAAVSSAGPSRSVSDNPVLWREVRRPLMSKRWQQIGASLLAGLTLSGFYMLLYADNSLKQPDAQIGFAFIFCGALTLLTCVVSATGIAQEKESDTWTLLLATPLSAWRIVMGKLLGLARRLMWPGILIAGHFLLFTIGGVLDWTTLWVVLWMIFTTNIVWLATGLYFSLRLRTVTFAVIMNLVLVATLYGGMAIGLAIAGEVIENRGDDWAEIVGVYAPYPYMGVAIEHAARSARYANYYATYDPQPKDHWVPVFHNVTKPTFLTLVFFVGVGHLAATVLVIWWTVARFNRMVGRAPQREQLPAMLPATA